MHIHMYMYLYIHVQPLFVCTLYVVLMLELIKADISPVLLRRTFEYQTFLTLGTAFHIYTEYMYYTCTCTCTRQCACDISLLCSVFQFIASSLDMYMDCAWVLHAF